MLWLVFSPSNSFRSRLCSMKVISHNSNIRRWAVVGVSTTLMDWALFVLFYRLNHDVLISNSLSLVLSTSTNHLLHHNWTFRNQARISQSTRRFALWTITLSLLESFLVARAIYWGLPAFMAKGLAMGLLILVSFTVLRKWVYKK